MTQQADVDAGREDWAITRPRGAPRLSADTPAQWLAVHLDARMRVHEQPDFKEADRSWLTIADVLADDAAVMRAAHTQAVQDDGATAAAAAKWTAGAYAGRLAFALGYVYAFASAAAIVAPEQVRFGLHPDGWTQLVDLGDPELAVLGDHPWAGRPGVRVVADEPALAELVVASLRAAAEPVLDATRGLAKVGSRALWAEIADDFALTPLHQLEAPGDTEVAARVRAALSSPSAPWRTVPRLFVVEHRGVPTFVGRKGGCCLAYQCEPPAGTPNEHSAPEAPVDERLRAWEERFPQVQDAAAYCTTCSLRDVDGCVERQLFWLDQERVQ